MHQSSEQLSQIASAMLMLCASRSGGRTVCPSEVARLLEKKETAWRALLPAVRHVAAEMARHGIIEVTQEGQLVDVATVRGPIRLRIKSCPA